MGATWFSVLLVMPFVVDQLFHPDYYPRGSIGLKRGIRVRLIGVHNQVRISTVLGEDRLFLQPQRRN